MGGFSRTAHRGRGVGAAITLILLAFLIGCGGQSGKQEFQQQQTASPEAALQAQPSFGHDETDAAGSESDSKAEGPAEGVDLAQAQPPDQAPAQPPAQAAPPASPPVRPNRPPVARFEVRPIVGYADMTSFVFDASFTTDDVNLAGEMQSRWDYDGDGKWDTSFSRATRLSHAFPQPGTYRPRLEVRDSGGLTSTALGSEVTVRENCPAPDFAMIDNNPNSATYGQEIRLSNLRGRRLVMWLASPTH